MAISAGTSEMEGVITSLLDTDMYKLTIHAAVYMNFPDAKVTYSFKNRSPSFVFNAAAVEWLRGQFMALAKLKFTEDEINYLKKAIPYLPDKYLEYLSSDNFGLKPQEQIIFSSSPVGDDRFELNIMTQGLWHEAILYEIPVLALVSEAYFRFVDTDWNMENQLEKAYDKAKLLLENGIMFSEFGTRRRRSLQTQDVVIQGLMKAAADVKGSDELFLGTSNVYFAKKYDIKPIGTVAHEWFMGIASIFDDYSNANKNAVDYWLKTFGVKNAGFALTDTFGTDDFLKIFVPPYSDAYIGVRQDSGDPVEYTKKIAHHYHSALKYPRFSKFICYSDSLNPNKALEYAATARENGLKSCFGIGTNLTNDFQKVSDPKLKSEPLNIVIKLLEVNGNHAIKISDNLGKNMGDPEKVRQVKQELGYIEHTWKGDNEAHRWAV